MYPYAPQPVTCTVYLLKRSIHWCASTGYQFVMNGSCKCGAILQMSRAELRGGVGEAAKFITLLII